MGFPNILLYQWEVGIHRECKHWKSIIGCSWITGLELLTHGINIMHVSRFIVVGVNLDPSEGCRKLFSALLEISKFQIVEIVGTME
jgi:hypothetical protein